MSDKTFSLRLAAIRASESVEEIRKESCYRNGQLLVNSDDVSQWDNYDRYFKFGNIHVDGEPPVEF